MSNSKSNGASSSETPTILTLVYLMQAMKLAVSRGMRYWVHNQVRLDRIEPFHHNMRTKRGVDADDLEQLRQRRNNIPRCRLFFRAPKENDTMADWWLLATSPLAGEPMKDAFDRQSRVAIGSFELVRLSRPGNGPCWTWRCEPQAWTQYERKGLHLARQKDLRQAHEFMDQLAKWPGESGLRQQRLALFRTMSSYSHGELVVPFLPFARFLRKPSDAALTADTPAQAAR
ncbi:MAG: hypothetical protein EPN36_13335 [Rhodanobacteraceae bacterium]|nr:MAG: hypothetical protein EPN36_13335 [Rhodanobacteraceae bacterium]